MKAICRTIWLVCLLLISFSIFAGRYDSLMNVIKIHRNDSHSLNAYRKLLLLLESAPTLYEKNIKEAITLSELQNNNRYKSKFAEDLAEKYERWGEFVNARKYYQMALEYYEQQDSLKKVSDLKNSLGRVYEKLSNYEKAITYYLESMKIREKLKDKKGIASSLNSLGLIYFYQENYPMAQKYFKQSLALITELNNEFGMATVYNNLGMLFFKIELYDSALYYYTQSLKLDEKNENLYGISSVYLNIANVLSKKKDTLNAEKFYFKSLKLKEQLKDKAGQISIYNSLAVLYQNRKKYNKAIEYARRANTIANELSNVEGIMQSSKILSEIYQDIGNYKDAYENYTWYIKLRDSVFKAENFQYISQLQEQYQAEKREQEIKLANSKLKENELKIKQQTTLLYAAIVVILLIASLVVVVLRSYREKKRANELLFAQNEEITLQKNIIEEKNKDILASITYAQRIQRAILPSFALMQKHLPEIFVLYKPKDIVSGDFYWFMPMGTTVLFAVVDCTGHGVPGAFMSIVGYNGLNQVVNDKTKHNTGIILDKLNERVKSALHTEEERIRDGMDIALCSVDKNQLLLRYSGANNPLYLIRSSAGVKVDNAGKVVESEGYMLYEFKATSQPIGEYVKENNFEMTEILLAKGDTIYIFSDGFADQFGGSEGKKLKYKAFKELLLSIQHKTMNEQQQILDAFFEQWKNGYEQIDDVCIMGVRI